MVKLICTLGTSPGGIYETYINLVKGNYDADNPQPVEINDIYIIRTSDKSVEYAWKLVKALFTCLREELPTKVSIGDIVINSVDINSKKDYDEFKKVVAKVISKGDFVDFTGGRKAMSVAAAIEALKKEANIVTTIIPQQEYNRIQQEIGKLKEREKEIEDAGKGQCGNIVEELRKLIVKGESKTILLS